MKQLLDERRIKAPAPQNWGKGGRERRAFTLIEVLVVIAITSVLITLLFLPLLKGFDLTAQAQTDVQAQDSARVAMEQISRELESAAAVRDTTHQYLDMEEYIVPPPSAVVTPTETLAHAYDAYIDIIPPRASNLANVTDPTVNPNAPTSILTPSAAGTGSSLVVAPATLGLPIAPGTTIVRWFVGLRQPMETGYVPGANGTQDAQEQPYVNKDERQTFAKSNPAWGDTQVVQNNLNNPYILYRAQVSPYMKNPSAPGTWEVNSQYFDTDGNGQPILDDSDFFRVETANEVVNGATITQAEAKAHNDRVYYWTQAAKPIIDINDVNLIIQPHKANDGPVEYNSGPGANGWLVGQVADASGAPILDTSVNFEPAGVSGDALAPTATSDVSQGYGTNPPDAISPYIPAQYKASDGQWVGGPDITITGTVPGGVATAYNTYPYLPPAGATLPTGINAAGDLIEDTAIDGTLTNVYDVSAGTVLNNATQYVAMSVDGDAGEVNFAVPSVPGKGTTTTTYANGNMVGTADNTNQNNVYYFMTFSPYTANLEIHLENLGMATDDYLLPTGISAVDDPTSANQIPNARIVVNSERVYGPDETPGPGSSDSNGLSTTVANYQPIDAELVPYTRLPADSATIGPNQYTIDYDNGVIDLGEPGVNMNVSDDPSDQYAQRRTVLVAFDYQNNDVISYDTNETPQQITGETADTVEASYQTASRLQVTMGIRLYDATTGQPTYYSLSNAVDVSNGSR